MKVLFLELTREKNIEYEVNHLLAANSGAADFEAHVIAQGTPEILRGRRLVERQQGRLHFYYADFGRDLSLRPRPGKLRRAWMMARRLPAAAALVARVIRAIRPDFIYTSQQRFDVLAAGIARRLTGIPHVLHLYYQVSPRLGRFVFGELRRTPYLITCSQYNLAKAAQWGIDPQTVALCPNPIDPAAFDLPREANYVQRRFGFPEGAPVIVSVGRLDPDKRVDVTLRAFAQAVKEVPQARLLVCGESYLFPNHRAEIEALVRELGLEQRVVLGGFVDDLPRILVNSDIFCLPSESDVFSVAILEAMAAGLPVLSVRDGGTPEIVADGETGLLCDLDDVDSLSRNMTCLLQEPALRLRMGRSGRARIQAALTPQIVGPRWMALLRSFDARERRRPVSLTATPPGTEPR